MNRYQNLTAARAEIEALDPDDQYNTMIQTAAIITRLLEPFNIKPIVVGGLSVEIYTQNAYSTRDIDFVSEGYDTISEILLQLGFQKEGRHFFHEAIEVALEIPSSFLEGDYEKVTKVVLDDSTDQYVYLISIEDIIIDRLRAAVHWMSAEDAKWGFELLLMHFSDVDKHYLRSKATTTKELIRLEEWLTQIENGLDLTTDED
ncbi:DUF6036 family nucleotidyltransferase [Exiguobacterium flavidum]|uniref:DUF6036 family nucleotidyltransferase n=1 Tax=Exiguobacterium flavidum TaxID=2184695 RepID=UPI000DF79F4C|nr:DUF6036 family nucleotidyltransferase [Exiguobacterium flavidum]